MNNVEPDLPFTHGIVRVKVLLMQVYNSVRAFSNIQLSYYLVAVIMCYLFISEQYSNTEVLLLLCAVFLLFGS
jgi:hypothetical protein